MYKRQGEYRIVGYRLLDKLDEEIPNAAAPIDEAFTVVANGLTVKDLTADVQARGMVQFRLTTGTNRSCSAISLW